MCSPRLPEANEEVHRHEYEAVKESDSNQDELVHFVWQPPNGSRLSCGALKTIHSLIYARRQLQARVRQQLTLTG